MYQVRHSKGEQSTNCTPLKDLYYGDDIAPVKDISRPNTQSTDNIASITGEEANELQSERLNTLTDDDAPLKTETEMYKYRQYSNQSYFFSQNVNLSMM